MQRLMQGSVVLVIGIIAAPAQARPPLGKLFSAIKHVETGTRTKDFPRGDQGRSRGPYQIQFAYWKDSGVPGKWSDCERIDYSQRVMVGYWRRYCPKALEQGNYHVLARVHNGGPAGHRRSATLPYWAKVKAKLRD
jgi:hypothetical protein